MQNSRQYNKQNNGRHRLPSALLSICLALGALATPIHASSAPYTTKSQHSAGESKAKKKKDSSKVKHHASPSEESRQERDKRLTRECRGAPNAGACLGYARP